MFCSFALKQKNQKFKAAFFLLKSGSIPLKGLKLASLRQSPLLNAPFLLISLRKKNEAGPSFRSASPSLGCGCGPISFASLACHFVTVLFLLGCVIVSLLLGFAMVFCL